MTNAISSCFKTDMRDGRRMRKSQHSSLTSEGHAGSISSSHIETAACDLPAPAAPDSGTVAHSHIESATGLAADCGAARRDAIARHRTLNTAALVIAMGSVCIPIYTKQRRGARHLSVWIAKVGAAAIGLHLLQVSNRCSGLYDTVTLL